MNGDTCGYVSGLRHTELTLRITCSYTLKYMLSAHRNMKCANVIPKLIFLMFQLHQVVSL